MRFFGRGQTIFTVAVEAAITVDTNPLTTWKSGLGIRSLSVAIRFRALLSCKKKAWFIQRVVKKYLTKFRRSCRSRPIFENENALHDIHQNYNTISFQSKTLQCKDGVVRLNDNVRIAFPIVRKHRICLNKFLRISVKEISTKALRRNSLVQKISTCRSVLQACMTPYPIQFRPQLNGTKQNPPSCHFHLPATKIVQTCFILTKTKFQPLDRSCP